MRIIIGLGNPGQKYRLTRHNAGFMAIEVLGRDWKIEVAKKSCRSLMGQGKWKANCLVLAKPLTYMNDSGQAVADLVKSNQLALEDILVICDDLALPVGCVRLRASGSSGGHHGLESILTALNSDQFPRLRVGIGPFPSGQDATEFVLNPFSKEELEKITEALNRIPEVCQVWLEQGIQKAMSLANAKEIL